MTEKLSLPAHFEFGVAAASYQIEGAVHEDDRGPSIWDTFSHTPGKVENGDTGDVACDHFHRYPEDISLMKQLGVDSYRLSLAWPRIQADGDGPANEKGLDFYDRIVDELLRNDIAPAVTLYHWDLPQTLEDHGGWRSRDTAYRFAEYAQLVHEHLGDRVHRWITLNEPFCSAILGYSEGRHAPGAREGEGALRAAHHLLLGHGLALQAMREANHPGDELGITLNLQPVSPATQSAEDVAAAERSLLLANRLFTDPVLAATYPELARSTWTDLTDFSFVRDGDLDLIGAPLDFLGVNYYFPSIVTAVDHDEADPARRTADDIGAKDVIEPGTETTEMGWPVDPDGLRRLLGWLRETYPTLPPVFITENGRAVADVVGADGRVVDPERTRYLQDHLAAVGQAIEEGTEVRGYYCWTLMDNFEWAYGYDKRFGLVHVDYATQVRTPKDSYFWYQQFIREQHTRR